MYKLFPVYGNIENKAINLMILSSLPMLVGSMVDFFF